MIPSSAVLEINTKNPLQYRWNTYLNCKICAKSDLEQF